MPYTADNPPEAIKGLPEHAVEIWVSAYNSAFEQYDGDEAKSAATAWAAVQTKYKKEGDKWVAKESNNLQALHHEILQEFGRRNASKDVQRIHNIIELLQELLGDEEEVDSKKIKKIETVAKEAVAVLAWLKEQKVVKTEEGVQFPAEAFAYAPDADKPSDWKLRLWEDPEKKVTKAQLGKAAAALSPGGFRGQRVDIPRDGLLAVKRKIRTEYRRLDVEDEDIPRWVKETETRTILADYVSFEEASIGGKGIATIVVIKPGFNESKENYYLPETLARDSAVFEGVKMYADHPTEEDERQRPERSIKDWVATLKNVHLDDKGQIVGEAVVVEPWMQAKLAQLRDNGMLQEMGISINAVGTATKGEIEGVKTNVIERIVRVRSVDFVTEPGAGGMVQMYEVDRENDIDIINLDILRDRRPDLVKSIEASVKAETLKEVKRMQEHEERIKELEGTVETVTQERDELQVKITEAEKAQRIAEAKSKVDEAVSKSELPEAAKVRILERFADAENADEVDEAIKAEMDYVTALKEAGKVKGLGGSQPNPQADKEALKESFKRMHPEWSDKELETAVEGR